MRAANLDRHTFLRRLRLARIRCDWAKADIDQVGMALGDELITVKGAVHWLTEIGLENLVEVDEPEPVA
jgi:hypothetical protein